MIDPNNIVEYNYTDDQLEELAIFCICVAGKTAKTIAPRVHTLVKGAKECGLGVFDYIAHVYLTDYILSHDLKDLGIGCYTAKAESIFQLINSEFDLRTCSVSDLETIKGIGPKTSRFFIMSSREGVEYAALDTHVLKWLRDQGIENVPKSTPSGKRYLDLEQTYLKMIPRGKTAAEFDLEIWREYSGNL